MMSRNVQLFLNLWMWKFSSNHMPPWSLSFLLIIYTKIWKIPHATPPASKGLARPELHPALISARPRGMWCWSTWIVSPLLPLDKYSSRGKKCHSPCPVAPMPAVLANRPQRLSSPFNHRSCCFLSVSVGVVPAQAFKHVFPGLMETWSAACPARPNLWRRRQLQPARW